MKKFKKFLLNLTIGGSMVVGGMTQVAAAANPPTTGEKVMTTDAGVRVKVIARKSTAVFVKPDMKSDSAPVGQFQFFYVLPPDDTTDEFHKDGFYRVTTARNGKEIGWIPAEDCVLWLHNQVLDFTVRDERPLTLFFKSREELNRAFLKRDGSLAMASEPKSPMFFLAPILDVKTTTVENESVPVFKCAFLVGDPGGAKKPTAPVTLQQLAKTCLLYTSPSPRD